MVKGNRAQCKTKSSPCLGWARPQATSALQLQSITNKVGYPDQWRDFCALEISRGKGWETQLPHGSSFRQLAKAASPWTTLNGR